MTDSTQNSELRLLRSYENGPRIWDAAEVLPRVFALVSKGLIEPTADGNAYQLTDAGRNELKKPVPHAHDVVYTLTVHDEKYPGLPDQAAGVYGGENALNAAVAAARNHWAELAGPDAMKLDFSSYESSNTGLDFHVAFGYRSYENAKVTYSVNGFTVQRG